MPDVPYEKIRAHPGRRHAASTASADSSADDYVELAVTTSFTFLTGASHPDEYVQQAADLGYSAIAVADRNSLAGVVRGHVAARCLGLQLVVGCRLSLTSHPEFDLLVYPATRGAYGRLCSLLTRGKRRATKGNCELSLDDLADSHTDLLAIALFRALPENAPETLRRLKSLFDDDRLSLAITRLYAPGDDERGAQLVALSEHVDVPLVAVNDVHYHTPQRRPLQDVLACIRSGCTIDQAGFRLLPNAERTLKPPGEMARLFADLPAALARSVQIARRTSGFSLDQLRYEYPDEVCPANHTPMQHLRSLTWQGAAGRYPEGIPDKVRRQIEYEFALIEELRYAPYFLTVHDLVRFARSRDILCQGRGAAANSAVCYCLGVTSVDPARIDVLFERFVSRERDEPPDIDIDFEHERREEVIQYIYRKYGRDRAGLTAEVITYRGRSAVRDVGKALGLSLDAVDRLAKRISHWAHHIFDDGDADEGRSALREMGFDPDDRTIRRFTALTRQILGFPRHLSQHVGGFIITRGPLRELVPIENAAMADRTVVEWDKDDIEAMGMLKVDVLGLGMLTCIRKCFELVEQSSGRALTLANVPAEDPAVYDLVCNADTIGVFQIESRAQMSMLPRLRPRCFYDLVIEVAIVRPGPIVGNMVHPYLRRRNGLEPVVYPDEKVAAVLGKTLGVPLFQEQAMSLAIVAAGFTPGEAELLRRAITAWKSRDAITPHRTRFIEGMVGNGYPRTFAEECFDRLKGFSQYGFPESHAASFALLVYVSAWLKVYYPAAFAAALLNSQPMGFYAPAQIVRDARDHGVEVRPVDVHHSAWDCTLEGAGRTLRLGMRLVSGLREGDAARIIDAVRRYGRFESPHALWRAARVSAAVLHRLAAADAFGSMGLARQRALWEVRALHGEPSALLDDAAADEPSPPVRLPGFTPYAEVQRDYSTVGLSLKNHPLVFLRSWLSQQRAITAAQLRDPRRTLRGHLVTVAGLVLVRQRPGTANGVMFMTLEDETGRADVVIRPEVYERFRTPAFFSGLVLARGRVERNGQVVHVLVQEIHDIAHRLEDLPLRSRDFR